VAKVVIVTGASQGIGAEIVKGFRERDYRIVANSRSIGPSDNPNILTVPGDIGDPAVAKRIVSEAVARFGRIDTLVNNAGIFIPKPFTEFTVEDYQATMNVNMAGFFHVTKQALAQMEKQKSGHVLTITGSIDNGTSNGGLGLAAMTKGGLNAVTRALAIEYAKSGIRVNGVAPGVVNTPMHRVEDHEMLGSFHPLGRIAEPSEIASAVLFLEAAGFVTGEIVHVDGGSHAGR